MQYRKDNKSGNELSALGLGCMRFPQKSGRIDMEETERIIKNALERGINYFDTAYIYSGSEAALGSILHQNSLREKAYIATKMPLFLCKKPSDFDKFFNTQLERLKTDYIDYYFMHMLTCPTQWEALKSMGVEKWLDEKKREGKIKNIGFSFHGKKDDFTALIDAYPWEFCMIQYNYCNINYQAGMEGLKYAHSKGLPVIVMEPLLGGRLADGLPPKAEELFKKTNAALTPAAWALRWLWEQPEVTVVLSGMGSMAQLDENVKTAEASSIGMLTADEREAYSQAIEIFNESYKIPCTGCNYCMPCPLGVNIPGCFSAYNSSYAIGKKTGMQQYMTGTNITSKTPSYAGLCKKCGKCEKHCPQSIKVAEAMGEVKKRMEPLWFKVLASGAKRFVK
ncbi:MAG: aldo/keto reductase [Oscillospiraceae bacterium]|nr:aldo/keto reductase [Oscillospiraceae bacterium]